MLPCLLLATPAYSKPAKSRGALQHTTALQAPKDQSPSTSRDDDDDFFFDTADDEDERRELLSGLYIHTGIALHRLTRAPQEIRNLKTLESAGWHLRMSYDMPIGNSSRFFYTPGLAYSLETFSFDKNPHGDLYTLHVPDKQGRFSKAWQTLRGRTTTATGPIEPGKTPDAKYSSLGISYMEIAPLACKVWIQRKEEELPKIFLAAGYKLGMRWNAFTDVRYTLHGQSKRTVQEESFNLNKLRHGLYVQAGWSRLSLITHMHFSSLFAANEHARLQAVRTYSVGLLLNL